MDTYFRVNILQQLYLDSIRYFSDDVTILLHHYSCQIEFQIEHSNNTQYVYYDHCHCDKHRESDPVAVLLGWEEVTCFSVYI